MSVKYYCEMMKSNVENECDQHCRMECPDCLIIKEKKEYGIIIKDGTSSYIKIKYCPWCGKLLSK